MSVCCERKRPSSSARRRRGFALERGQEEREVYEGRQDIGKIRARAGHMLNGMNHSENPTDRILGSCMDLLANRGINPAA